MAPLVVLARMLRGAVAWWFVPVGGERWVGWHWSLAIIHHGTWDLYYVSWSQASVWSARPRYSMFIGRHTSYPGPAANPHPSSSHPSIHFPSLALTLPIPLTIPSSISSLPYVALISFLNKTSSPHLFFIPSPLLPSLSLNLSTALYLIASIKPFLFFSAIFLPVCLLLFLLFHSTISLFT